MNRAYPVFSVVIPLFNKAAHIKATLGSVAAQKVPPHEIIIVDDGSSDDGPARAEGAALPGLRIVRQPNAGPGAARNRGIAEATGDWIAFLDADDLWTPMHLTTLAETIAAFPVADLVATGFTRGEDVCANASIQGGPPRSVAFFSEHYLIWTSAVAVRRAVLLAEPFGAAWPGEDVELWLRLALRHRFAVHPRKTAVYVQRTGGAMDSVGADQPAAPIGDQPIFRSIAAVLDDPVHAARHVEVARLRNRLMLDYVRPSLFNGQVRLARAYLSALQINGVPAPLTYRILARLPGPVVRNGSRMFSSAKRILKR